MGGMKKDAELLNLNTKDQVDRIEYTIISCQSDKRMPGLGTALVKKMVEIARARGLKYHTVITTGAFSSKIFQKFGFKEVFTMPYVDYKVDGKVVFPPENPHTQDSSLSGTTNLRSLLENPPRHLEKYLHIIL